VSFDNHQSTEANNWN